MPQAQRHNWRRNLRRIDVGDIVCDSRQVKPGDVYVAYPGVSVDGHRFVPQALAAGAALCVVERPLAELADHPYVLVPNGREAYAYLHAARQGFPASKMVVVGVTGTDGKTTTTRLVSGVLVAAGHKAGRVDSVSAAIGHAESATGFHTTTPDAPDVQRYLAEMVDDGVEYAVIESTSHGLAQYRVAACEYDVAVVTNITHEHLDSHGTYEAYRDAKAMLFRYLTSSTRKPGVRKVAVLNVDDSSFEYLVGIPADVQLTYGLHRRADIRAGEVQSSLAGLAFDVTTPSGAFRVTSPLLGRYNAYNILAAIAVGHSQGVAPDVMAQGIASVQAVPGRMECVDCGQPFLAIVDFAHTPNALENALRAVRDHASGKAIVAFGCAGLRDVQKRPWMGEIAGRLADRTIITAEDPRTEALDDIMAEIAAGCEKAGGREGETYWRVADRAEAIRVALGMAEPGDVVIATGKGHEQSMCYGTVEHPWSDRQAMLDALTGLGYVGSAR